MYTTLTTTLMNVSCPQNTTKADCNLRKYIEKGQDFFFVSINENHLVPMSNDIRKFLRVYKKMQNICYECQSKNQGR